MKLITTATMLLLATTVNAQTYPEPEFSNEVYFLKKDSVTSVVRLEKESSKMGTKSKGAGFGGYENGYTIEGDRSSVRLTKGSSMSFVYFTGSSSGGSSAYRDSLMKANGASSEDMRMMGGMGDPANSVSLYKADVSKGKRKILMYKAGGMFSGGKLQSSDKYTFSVKKVREGYWELVIDKPLQKGEYAFTTMSYTAGSMDGSATLYTFGVD